MSVLGLEGCHRQVVGVGYVDELTLRQMPHTRHVAVVVHREYLQVAERLSLQYGAPWVSWRKAMQGAE